MDRCESWNVKKAECRRIDAFELWRWRRLLRVPWTARRSNQSILKEINLEYSFSSVQSLSRVRLFATPWIEAHQASLSITTPRVYPNSCPSSQWCHPAISSSVVAFSSCPQSLPASKSFPMSQLFTWGSQSTGVSALASFLPKKSQGIKANWKWSNKRWQGWTSTF